MTTSFGCPAPHHPSFPYATITKTSSPNWKP
jgi:hypothetical protein